TTGSARKWWEDFERQNGHLPHRVLELALELQRRRATITEFFLAYVYSNTDSIRANLAYLDYTRIKKREEEEKDQGARRNYEEIKPKLGWDNAGNEARNWWQGLEEKPGT